MKKDDKAVSELRKKVDKEYQDRQTKLFEKWHVGFCFGKEQLDEYISSQRNLGYTGKFTSLGMGMLCRSDVVDDFVAELESLHKEWKKAKRNVWTMDAYIEYTLWNYECFYVGYVEDRVKDAVRDYFPEATDEDIMRVYNNTRCKIDF